MAILRIVWATHYLRWVAILGATAVAHVAAFCVCVGDSGWGGGTSAPETRVTLYLAEAEPASVVPLTPIRTTERPVELPPVPVEVTHPPSSPEQALPAPSTGNPCALQPMPLSCPLPQTPREDVHPVAANNEPPCRTIDTESMEINQPISMGDRRVPPCIVPADAKIGTAAGASLPTDAHANASRHSGRGVPNGLSSPTIPAGEGIEADFALNGKPAYPVECRRSECTGRVPCEGTSRWRITVSTPNARPSHVKRVQSAGCVRLDAGTELFLRKAHIPRAGVFLLRFRFKLDGSR